MTNDFSYGYVGNYKFGLNIPPFTLKILVSNFENNETIQIKEVVNNWEDLPKNMHEVLGKSAHFKSYIRDFTDDYNLHFAVELHNKAELVHNEFFCKKVAEFSLHN